MADIAERIESDLKDKRWLSPMECYMAKAALERLIKCSLASSVEVKVKNCQSEIHLYIQKLEQVLALQSEFQGFAFRLAQEGQVPKRGPIWASYLDGSWLIGMSNSLGGTPPVLIVVRTQDIFASVKLDDGLLDVFSRGSRVIAGEDSEGETLGLSFPDLKISFPSERSGISSDKRSFQVSFYVLALTVILTLTLFGAYLLWRDVRRELRIAELRTQFVSSVSHEVKTPLTAIRMFAETLLLGRTKNDKTQTEYLETIVNESERLTRLLNNVLNFSKIEQGKMIYRPEWTSLDEVARATSRAMDYLLRQQGFRLHVYVEEGLPEARVDRDAIEQALLNLLHNAMKYSGTSRDIDLRINEKDGYALIQVTDRGIGIDPQEQERVFEKFYRIPTPENERLAGTGLGLSLVSHIVRAHGGRVELDSTPGEGSTFSLYLPLELKP